MHEPIAQTVVDSREWFGQPRGLTILFLTEAWEVFSFVGMRTMLVYYMTHELLIEQRAASVTYGLYSGFIYLTPIFGGFASDRWLGRRRAVTLGAAMMSLGHFMMMSDGLFYAALITIAVGNGFFLPGLPSQIDGLYASGDPRRQSAYSVYYMGKNVGAFVAPLVCGTLGELYGWHWGFGVAGIGMLVGLCIYVLGREYLPLEVPARHRVASSGGPVGRGRSLVLLAVVVVAMIIFRTAYEQIGNTVALWFEHDVGRGIGHGTNIPMTWFQSLNPILVFALTPLLVAHWIRLGRRGQEPGPLTKMACGAGLVALAYGALSLVAGVSSSLGTQPGWAWSLPFFALLTLGELYALPVGLALFSRLAPAALTATVIAVWYLTSFAGNLLAGVLGMFWSRSSPTEFFGISAACAALSCMILAAVRAPATALLSGRERGRT